MNAKIIVNAKDWNPSTCICKNSKYLKSIAAISVIMCDEINEKSHANILIYNITFHIKL